MILLLLIAIWKQVCQLANLHTSKDVSGNITLLSIFCNCNKANTLWRNVSGKLKSNFMVLTYCGSNFSSEKR